MLIITVVFEEKWMITLQDKKGALQECLWFLSLLKDVDDKKGRIRMTHFLILSMAAATARFWGPYDFETNDALRYFESPCSHSKILKSAVWRIWTALQTCDKNEAPRWREKLRYPDELRE